jgi:hypothetical protein
VDRLGVAKVGVLKLDGTALGDGQVVGVLARVLEAEGNKVLATLAGGRGEVFLVVEGSEARVSLAANFACLAGSVGDKLAFTFAINVVLAGVVLALECAVAVILVEFEAASGVSSSQGSEAV